MTLTLAARRRVVDALPPVLDRVVAPTVAEKDTLLPGSAPTRKPKFRESSVPSCCVASCAKAVPEATETLPRARARDDEMTGLPLSLTSHVNSVGAGVGSGLGKFVGKGVGVSLGA